MTTRTFYSCMQKSLFFGAMVAVAAGAFLVPDSARAQADVKTVNISASAIGRPPIFSNTYVDVGEAMGFFKAAGVDVNFRWFQRGSDTAKSVVTGDVAVGFTSSQAGLNLIASGAPVVAIAGMPNQDWIIATNDPAVKGCADLKGKTVAADGINNARTLYIAAVLATCGLKQSDLKLIDLANQPLVKAGIAGQVHSAVWHVDELAQVEFKTGKKWRLIEAPASITKGLHYAMLIASKKAIQENREGLIRYLEGWILTQNFMSSKEPGNKVAFAKVAANASQIDFKVALNSVDGYQAISYWVNNDGLDEKQMMSQLDQLVKIGSIKAAKKPTYDQIVDKSLYAEALKRVQSKYGILK
ncbi:MAG TPA: ABC transporter substrate-binding protein [Burkholderiales bacterium]|nr:ABC transporter substrate-binding protein [Burkholderiales bacterium]